MDALGGLAGYGSSSDEEEGGSPMRTTPDAAKPAVVAAPTSGLPDAAALLGGSGLPDAAALLGGSGLPDASSLFGGAPVTAPSVGVGSKRALGGANSRPGQSNPPKRKPGGAGGGGAAGGGKAAAAAAGGMLPPQLRGRSNVVTEDLDKMGVRAKKK